MKENFNEYFHINIRNFEIRRLTQSNFQKNYAQESIPSIETLYNKTKGRKVNVQTMLERQSIQDLLYLILLIFNYVLGIVTVVNNETELHFTLMSLIVELILFIEFVWLLCNIQKYRVRCNILTILLYSLDFLSTIFSIIIQLIKKQPLQEILRYRFTGATWYRFLLPCNFVNYQRYLHKVQQKSEFQQKTLGFYQNNIRWFGEIFKLINKMLYSPISFILLFVNLFILIFFSQDKRKLSFAEGLYFIVVTLSTVGYGDITLTSTAGRISICLFIILAIIYIPSTIQNCLQQWKIYWPIIKVGYKMNNSVCVVGHQDQSLSLTLRKLLPEYISIVFLNIGQNEDDQFTKVHGYVKYTNVIVQNIDKVSYEVLFKYNVKRASFIITHSFQYQDNETIMNSLIISKYLKNNAALFVILQNKNIFGSVKQLLSPFIQNYLYDILSSCEINAQILANSIIHKGFYVFYVNILSKKNLFTDVLFNEEDEIQVQEQGIKQLRFQQNSLLIENLPQYDFSITKKLIQQSVNIQLIRKTDLEEGETEYGDLGIDSEFCILYTKPDEDDIFAKDSCQFSTDFTQFTTFTEQQTNQSASEFLVEQDKQKEIKLAFLFLDNKYQQLLFRTKQLLSQNGNYSITEYYYYIQNPEENQKILKFNKELFADLKQYDQIVMFSQDKQKEFYIILQQLHQHDINNVMIFLDVLSLDMFNDRLGLSMEFLMGNIICIPARVTVAEEIFDHDNFINIRDFLQEVNFVEHEHDSDTINRTQLLTYTVIKETTLSNILGILKERNQRLLYFTKAQTVISYTPALDKEILFIEKNDTITVSILE